MFKHTLLALALLIAFSAIASSATVDFTAVDPSLVNPSDLTVKISVEDVTGGVKISATVMPGTVDTIGDLIGLFFMYDGAVPDSVTISGVTSNDMTPTAPPIGYQPGAVASWSPNSADMSFFLIGDNGLGKWDIQWVIYTAGSNPVLEASKFISAGARLTSVGVPGNREDSLKLVTPEYPNPPNEENPIPEPSTWMMLSAGIGLLALARRRRAA